MTYQEDNFENILENLNPVQREAVLYFDSPLLLIAGAGSGKTRVITNKIAYLIKKFDISPRHILGVTFTNKAAEEMRTRIQALTDIEARMFNISTFHSLGLRIMRESGSEVGYDADWQVMDDQDQRKIVEKIIKDNFSYFTNDMREAVRRKIGLAKMDLNYPNNREYLLQRGFSQDEFRIFHLYFEYQQKNKLWDYEDLVSLPVKMLKNNDRLRQKYENRYRYVVVDEFQDTNPNQYELLLILAGTHGQITIVGDDDQAVYSWRGASIRFLFKFEHDFPRTRIIKLEQNYRSTPQVLDFANTLISRNTARRPKSMWTNEKSGNPVFVLDTRSKEDEARVIGDLINHIKDERPDLLPVAILYRINSQSLAFETEFARRGIEFKILKGLRFFDRKEIKDSLALLKLAVQIDDDISFLRMVDFLPLGIGPKSLDTLSAYATQNNLSLFRALQKQSPDKFQSKEIFTAIFQYHLQVTTTHDAPPMSKILERLLAVSGYIEGLISKNEEDRRLNVEELIAFIHSWELANPGEPISSLMDYISLESGSKNETDNTSVFLLTMHNAKGLEFPTVVASGINTTYMPFFMRKGQEDIEEERRLFYVASTRSIKQLVISIGAEKKSVLLKDVSYSLYSVAYSAEDIMTRIRPEGSSAREKEINRILRSPEAAEEKYLEHAIFGRGKIISAIDKSKYLVEFVGKGQKLIDTSIVPVKFL